MGGPYARMNSPSISTDAPHKLLSLATSANHPSWGTRTYPHHRLKIWSARCSHSWKIRSARRRSPRPLQKPRRSHRSPGGRARSSRASSHHAFSGRRERSSLLTTMQSLPKGEDLFLQSTYRDLRSAGNNRMETLHIHTGICRRR